MATKPSSANTTLRPRIYIGLGSTGTKIISRLRDLIDQRSTPAAKDLCVFLGITSETEREDGVSRDLDFRPLSTDELTTRDAVVAVRDSGDPAAPNFTKWWYHESAKPWMPPPVRLNKGAGGSRAIGRLLLHYTFLRPNNELLTRLEGIQELLDKNCSAAKKKLLNVDDATYECYVFGILAGGTCSGTFLDLAFLLRRIFAKKTLYTYGVFMLGDICYEGASRNEINPFQQDLQRHNSLYALAEASLLQSASGLALIAPDWIARIGRDPLPDSEWRGTYPYDRIAIVGARNESGYLLEEFKDYSEFIAQYYAYDFLIRQRAPRNIDDALSNRPERDSQFPHNPNDFQRIGMLYLTVPTEKISAMLKQAIAEEIATVNFNNSDLELAEAQINKIRDALSWNSFEQQFMPPELPNPADFVSELEETSDEFGNTWASARTSIEDKHKPWVQVDLGNEQVKGQSEACLAHWRKAADEVISQLLGYSGGGRFSLGTLQYVLKSFDDLVREKVQTLTAWKEESRGRLYGQGADSMLIGYNTTLAALKEEFPEKSLNPMSLLRRRNWLGASDMAAQWKAYADEFRKYAAISVAHTALGKIKQDLEVMMLVRKLIGREAVEPVIHEERRRVDALFQETQFRKGLKEEILSGKGEIESVFVKGLLAEPSSDDPQVTRKEIAIDSILANWKSYQGKNILESWSLLVQVLHQHPNCRIPETALQNEQLVDIVEGLKHGFRKSFEDQFRAAFAEPILNLNLWDGLRRYVRNRKDQSMTPKEVLRKLFKYHFERAKYFTKLVPTAAKSAVEGKLRPDVSYVLDPQMAEACFQGLGIENAATFLDELFAENLGAPPNQLDSEHATPGEMVILFELTGQSPEFYAGFEDLGTLVANPDATQRVADKRRWTDARFPEWIKRWNEQKQKGS